MALDIMVREPEAFTEEFEDFNRAVQEMESDPVQTLRDWYISKGETAEMMIEFAETERQFPEFFAIP